MSPFPEAADAAGEEKQARPRILNFTVSGRKQCHRQQQPPSVRYAPCVARSLMRPAQRLRNTLSASHKRRGSTATAKASRRAISA
jgi:hypothetical protein